MAAEPVHGGRRPDTSPCRAHIPPFPTGALTMRFPSLDTLAMRARQVLARFPVTLAAGVAAAVFAIIASTTGADDLWARLAFVVALGLPLSFALTMLAELRTWPRSAMLLAMLAGAGALAV